MLCHCREKDNFGAAFQKTTSVIWPANLMLPEGSLINASHPAMVNLYFPSAHLVTISCFPLWANSIHRRPWLPPPSAPER
jgi:hypothetical protein